MAEYSDKIKNKLLQLEGGYTNDKNDHGGSTIYGITQKYEPQIYAKVYAEYISNNKDKAKEIACEYFEYAYWQKANCDKINDPLLAYNVFDMAINAGVSRAIIILQRTLNNSCDCELRVDGINGKLTLTATNSQNVKGLVSAYINARIKYYNDIAECDPTQKCFLNGWLNRAKACNNL